MEVLVWCYVTIIAFQGREDDAFPEGLRDIEGKRALLELKRKHYHMKFPKSSVSVSSFIICNDLLEEFNSVSTQVRK